MKNVLVVGYPDRIEEFKRLKLENARVQYMDQILVDQRRMTAAFADDIDEEDEFGFFPDDNIENAFGETDFSEIDVVFDLNMDENPENLGSYMEFENLSVIGCAVKRNLAQFMLEYDDDELEAKLFGYNALPGFIDRPRSEVSVYRDEDKIHLANLMAQLGMSFEIVADRVGMVTPRVICGIINEACFVLGEGTAEVEAVDRAMKLGTNYPFGPFEWADRIGLHNVLHVLDYLRAEYGSEKYKAAPILREYFRRNRTFYPEKV
ncbi:MAG: 3-hydroxyacyl-CoA dehydrogenase [Bacteroidia bacterium]|nr:3-hydroxyacyl-CoA dehydrogenase [Bacteroidia bacterium]